MDKPMGHYGTEHRPTGRRPTDRRPTDRPPYYRRLQKRGFTLVELLVAISILAIVAVLGWRGLDGIVRGRVALTSEMDQTRGMQLTFAQMQSDCEHMTAPSNIGGRPSLSVEPGRITMVRIVFADNQPSRFQVIAYRVREGVLERRELLATRDLEQLDAMWRAALEDTDGAQPVALQSDVGAMNLRLWRSDTLGWRTPETEAANAAATQSSAPPRGLEVAVQGRANQTSMVKVFMLGAV